MAKTLKPCPFCGSPAKIWVWNGGARVDCTQWKGDKSTTHFVGIGANTIEEAIMLWNTRKGEGNDTSAENLGLHSD